jgi:FtsZ-interacting cell division protein ZipA
MIKEKNILLIMVIAIIVIVAILLIVFWIAKKEERGLQKIEEVSGIAEEIHGFTAEIKEIKDKTLTLEGRIPMANSEEEPIKAVVKAIVTDETNIVKLKFPETPEGSEEPVYPEETKMSFEELKVGDKINIGTIENISENIKNQTEFTIDNIFIL